MGDNDDEYVSVYFCFHGWFVPFYAFFMHKFLSKMCRVLITEHLELMIGFNDCIHCATILNILIEDDLGSHFSLSLLFSGEHSN